MLCAIIPQSPDHHAQTLQVNEGEVNLKMEISLGIREVFLEKNFLKRWCANLAPIKFRFEVFFPN